MTTAFGSLSLRKKLLLLPCVMFLGLLLLQTTNFFLQNQIRNRIVLPSIENQVLKGDLKVLKTTVEVEGAILAEQLKACKSRPEQIALLLAQTDPIRFLDDHSGYFFAYDTSGVRINVPINKSQNNKNLLGLTDKNGFRFVEAFVNTAKAGGGEVDYWFEREGKGLQLKHSYVVPVAGTDFLIGAGVYIDSVQSEQSAILAQMQAQNRIYTYYTLTVFLFVLGLGIGLVWLISHSISNAVGQILQRMLASADQVTAASGQVATTSQTLADGASQQAETIQETSTSLQQLTAASRAGVQNAQDASRLAQDAHKAAEKGTADMRGMQAAMDAIKSSSDDIAKIIRTIDEIAFQTNILALNAAVEAARAGEAGMGFAVVADEVRALAQRSAQAAKETAAKIETAIGNTSRGVQISLQVNKTLSEIVERANKVNEIASGAAQASLSETTSLEQVDTAVSRMNEVTQSTAASAEESAAASEELRAQAEAMRDAVLELAKMLGNVSHFTHQEHLSPVSVLRQQRGFSVNNDQGTPSAISSHSADGHRNRQLDGRHTTAATILPPTSNTKPLPRSTIPLDGDFKDF